MKKSKKVPKTRDHLMVKIILGATKAAVHVDKKKKLNKKITRKKVHPEEES